MSLYMRWPLRNFYTFNYLVDSYRNTISEWASFRYGNFLYLMQDWIFRLGLPSFFSDSPNFISILQVGRDLLLSTPEIEFLFYVLTCCASAQFSVFYRFSFISFVGKSGGWQNPHGTRAVGTLGAIDLPQILADKLTLFQLGADYAHHITTHRIYRPSYVPRDLLAC